MHKHIHTIWSFRLVITTYHSIAIHIIFKSIFLIKYWILDVFVYIYVSIIADNRIVEYKFESQYYLFSVSHKISILRFIRLQIDCFVCVWNLKRKLCLKIFIQRFNLQYLISVYFLSFVLTKSLNVSSFSWRLCEFLNEFENI